MKLELSETQARVLINALDVYSRINMGQLWALADAIGRAKTRGGEELPDHWIIRDRHTDPMTRILFDYPPNASHGICSPLVPDAAKIAYDIQCVIRKDIAEREKHSQSSVWHGEPLHTCKSEPLAKVIE